MVAIICSSGFNAYLWLSEKIHGTVLVSNHTILFSHNYLSFVIYLSHFFQNIERNVICPILWLNLIVMPTV